jgi:serine/threonine-protein kinase RsbW
MTTRTASAGLGRSGRSEEDLVPDVENAADERPTSRPPPSGVWAWPAVHQTVSVARAAVGEYVRRTGTGAARLDDIRLAVSEAVTNVVVHAYIEAATPGEVRVRLLVADDDVVLVVEDDGRGMLPRSDSPGSGMGLPLITAVADGMETLPTPAGGTRLTMHFQRNGAAADTL